MKKFSLTHLFNCLLTGSLVFFTGCLGSSFSATGIQFSGLQKSDVIVSQPNLSYITLSWDAATHASGSVIYRVYGGGGVDSTGTPITASNVWNYEVAVTSELSYVFNSPTVGLTYYFAVEAVDTSTQGTDGNTTSSRSSFPTGKIIRSRFFPASRKHSSRGNSTVTLEWDPSPGAESRPLQYLRNGLRSRNENSDWTTAYHQYYIVRGLAAGQPTALPFARRIPSITRTRIT